MTSWFQDLAGRLAEGGRLTAGAEITPERVASADPLDLMALARLSASLTGPPPFTCGIINIKSGRCGEDCAFCAQSGHYQTGNPSYAMLSPGEILSRAENIVEAGANYVGLVASGASLSEQDFASLMVTAEVFKKRFNVGLCTSIGSLDPERARTLKSAGFASCHHNLEAAPSFFPNICTTHTTEDRLKSIRAVKEAGLRVCCGGIFGVGENWAQRLELAALVAELGVNSVPINFLMPVPGTPLADRPLLPAGEALKIIAAFRLLNPESDILICGGREMTLGGLKSLIYSAGANGLMIGDYLTAKGSSIAGDIADMQALELWR